jgi:hypothetical protein
MKYYGGFIFWLVVWICGLVVHHYFFEFNDVDLVKGVSYSEGKIDTIIPNAIDSLQSFLKSYKQGNEDGLLHVVNLYLYGLHPEYDPDKITGMKLIQKISSDNHFSNNIKNVCRMFFEDNEKMFYNDIDSVGDKHKILPTNIVQTIQDIIYYHDKNNIKILKSTMNVSHKVMTDDIENNQENDISSYFNNTEEVPVIALVVHNDSQNVHNHSIQNISKNIIDRLEISKNTFVENVSLFYIELLKHKDIITKEDDLKITLILDSMSDNIHSKYEKSEKEVFNMVLERILNKTNINEKTSLFHMFTQNLVSIMEYDVVVCSTGKITRMLSTFDVLDTELPDMKPDWIIKQEIANLSSIIRKDILQKYETSDDSVTSEKMRLALIERCQKDYVLSNNLSQTALDNILTDYLEAF